MQIYPGRSYRKSSFEMSGMHSQCLLHY
uniref:Uncharacterized protein n=1 Tax=Heterorhabditis bacteriophora TaxID=37862 RepID=A0A1I7WJ62_HETBA